MKYSKNCRTSFLRIAATIVAAFFCFTAQIALAQETAPEGQRVDRFAQVFAGDGDQGKLVARFLMLSTGTEEKSGDSTILTSPDGKTMLVDSGAPECAPQVEHYLEALGIIKIDIVVVSHPHIDHLGGLARIIRKFPVESLYMSRVEYPTEVYKSFIDTVKKIGIRTTYLEEGSDFAFGEMVKVKIYNPERDIRYYDGYPANSTQFINNKSLVMKMSYGESSMLFMGDVYTPREIELAEKYGEELKADVIKVGHHGSDTSSSKSFVRLVSPKIAVMMHDSLASLQVYKNYRKVDAATYITYLDGCVKVAGDAKGNWSTVSQFNRMSDFLK